MHERGVVITWIEAFGLEYRNGVEIQVVKQCSANKCHGVK